jgi:membrane fusion protein (multidrug efflux system)
MRNSATAATGAVALVMALANPWPLLAQDAKSKSSAPAAKPMVLMVKAVPARAVTLSNEISAVGTLVANESVMIRPEVAGRVAAIHFTEGQPVAAGAPLVTLDAAEVRAQLEASRADERLALQRSERSSELFKKNFISQQALDDAREAWRKTTARRQEDEARLSKTELRAPFAGIVGLRQVSAGAYLRAGDDIARLDRIDVMKLDFRVPETYLGKIRREQPVRVRVDAYADELFQGRVYAVETAVDEKTRTVMLRARVPNPGARLKPGMFARVGLELDSRSGVVIVPEQAINPRGEKYFVFKVVDGKAERVEVTLGARRPGEVEIAKGVAAGDRVITENQPMLQPGMAVTIVTDKPPAKPATAVAPVAK